MICNGCKNAIMLGQTVVHGDGENEVYHYGCEFSEVHQEVNNG